MLNSRIDVRLDKYLHAQKTQETQKIVPSRSQIARWINQGYVLVNGKEVKASYSVKSTDQIEVISPTVIPSTLTAENIPLNILYEDKDLIVLNKPFTLVVHPGAGHSKGTLVHALLAHCKGLSTIGGVERPGIVHRLDKGTSGVMVVAKNDAAHQSLSEQFKFHRVMKIYWAVVYGKFTKKEGTISTFISRSTSDRKKFSVHLTKGKKAVTHYRVLKEGEGLSLIEINLETGRTHQIRVHLTDAGHSLVGDPVYGGHARKAKGMKPDLRKFFGELDHPLLHARKLGFCHPVTGEKMEFETSVPEDFKKAIDLCF